MAKNDKITKEEFKPINELFNNFTSIEVDKVNKLIIIKESINLSAIALMIKGIDEDNYSDYVIVNDYYLDEILRDQSGVDVENGIHPDFYTINKTF